MEDFNLVNSPTFSHKVQQIEEMTLEQRLKIVRSPDFNKMLRDSLDGIPRSPRSPRATHARRGSLNAIKEEAREDKTHKRRASTDNYTYTEEEFIITHSPKIPQLKVLTAKVVDLTADEKDKQEQAKRSFAKQRKRIIENDSSGSEEELERIKITPPPFLLDSIPPNTTSCSKDFEIMYFATLQDSNNYSFLVSSKQEEAFIEAPLFKNAVLVDDISSDGSVGYSDFDDDRLVFSDVSSFASDDTSSNFTISDLSDSDSEIEIDYDINNIFEQADRIAELAQQAKENLRIQNEAEEERRIADGFAAFAAEFNEALPAAPIIPAIEEVIVVDAVDDDDEALAVVEEAADEEQVAVEQSTQLRTTQVQKTNETKQSKAEDATLSKNSESKPRIILEK